MEELITPSNHPLFSDGRAFIIMLKTFKKITKGLYTTITITITMEISKEATKMEITKFKKNQKISWFDKPKWQSSESKVRTGIFVELKKMPHVSYPNGLTMVEVIYRKQRKIFNPDYYDFKLIKEEK